MAATALMEAANLEGPTMVSEDDGKGKDPEESLEKKRADHWWRRLHGAYQNPADMLNQALPLPLKCTYMNTRGPLLKRDCCWAQPTVSSIWC